MGIILGNLQVNKIKFKPKWRTSLPFLYSAISLEKEVPILDVKGPESQRQRSLGLGNLWKLMFLLLKGQNSHSCFFPKAWIYVRGTIMTSSPFIQFLIFNLVSSNCFYKKLFSNKSLPLHQTSDGLHCYFFNMAYYGLH